MSTTRQLILLDEHNWQYVGAEREQHLDRCVKEIEKQLEIKVNSLFDTQNGMAIVEIDGAYPVFKRTPNLVVDNIYMRTQWEVELHPVTIQR
jgi:hypothetical protein